MLLSQAFTCKTNLDCDHFHQAGFRSAFLVLGSFLEGHFRDPSSGFAAGWHLGALLASGSQPSAGLSSQVQIPGIFRGTDQRQQGSGRWCKIADDFGSASEQPRHLALPPGSLYSTCFRWAGERPDCMLCVSEQGFAREGLFLSPTGSDTKRWGETPATSGDFFETSWSRGCISEAHSFV